MRAQRLVYQRGGAVNLLKMVLQRLIKKKDFYAIISFYALSFYIIYVARDFRVIPGVPRAQNPGFYPLLLAGLLVVLNTGYLFQTLKKTLGEFADKEEKIADIADKEEKPVPEEGSETEEKSKEKIEKETEKEAEKESEEPFWGKSTALTRKKLLIAVVMVYLYLHLLNWLGFFSSSFLFLVVMTRVLFAEQKSSFKKIVFLTFVITVVIFIIFDLFIGIRFPDGILF